MLVYLRKSDDSEMIVAVNFTPVPRHNYRIGVSTKGKYEEVLNSDAGCYGGSNVGNGAMILEAEDKPWMERPYSMLVVMPPLAGIVLKLVNKSTVIESNDSTNEEPNIKAVSKLIASRVNSKRHR